MRSTWVTRHAPPVLPATVSPSQSPTRPLEEAASGRSEMSWVIRILPLRSAEPLPCLRLPRCLRSLEAFPRPGSSQSRAPEATAR